MPFKTSRSKVAQPVCPVKPSDPYIHTHPQEPMIHHKELPPYIVGSNLEEIIRKGKGYGVSSSYKVITKGLLLKKWDTIRTCLIDVCNLTTKERDVVLALLRLQAYYPQVYPKAAQIAEDENVGIATFWRTVDKLRDMNLLEVVNRFLIRPEAQISNLYLLDELIIVIARYLAEHGTVFLEKWLRPWLSMPGRDFWPLVIQGPEARAGPLIPGPAGP